MTRPRYLDAFESGVLGARMQAALEGLRQCRICPRRCGADRLSDERGFCRTGRHAVVCSYFAHRGEEPPISGTRGAGIIFFSHCNLRCVYCQNYQFSQEGEGSRTTAGQLAGYMMALQEQGCHNINLATPTHVMPQILEALFLAVQQGLRIPLVYNTSGYELPEMIRLLDGIVDIYLPDMRYAEEADAVAYSFAPGYPAHNQESVLEMIRQTGGAQFDGEGNLTRGVIVRHLVLPNNISGTEKIFAFLARPEAKEARLSLMSQYFPTHQAHAHPALNRRLHLEEYEEACRLLNKYGLENGWIQEAGGLQRFAGTHIKRNV